LGHFFRDALFLPHFDLQKYTLLGCCVAAGKQQMTNEALVFLRIFIAAAIAGEMARRLVFFLL
jgi:hypothetical protein